MVGGRGELAERERLRRDGLPQRRFVGGRLVRAVRCVARNQMAPALALYLRHLDGSEIDWGKKIEAAGTLAHHHRAWATPRLLGRPRARAPRSTRRALAPPGAASCWTAGPPPPPQSRPRRPPCPFRRRSTESSSSCLSLGASPWLRRRGRPTGGRAGGRRRDQARNAGHAPSRRPPSPRAEHVHAPASQHRRGVSNSWNAMHRPWPCPQIDRTGLGRRGADGEEAWRRWRLRSVRRPESGTRSPRTWGR